MASLLENSQNLPLRDRLRRRPGPCVLSTLRRWPNGASDQLLHLIKPSFKGLVKENASTELLVAGRPFSKGSGKETVSPMPLTVLCTFPKGFERGSASEQLLSAKGHIWNDC